MTGPLTAGELEGIAARLDAAGVSLRGSLSASLISGGRSNLTVLLRDDASRWVLRTPPRHGRTPSAHDVEREFRVTAALRGSGVPVAGAVCLETDADLLGGPFAVWDFVEGTTVQTRAALEDLAGEAGLVDTLVDVLVEALAALHDVDYLAVGLDGFGRPDAYVERQISRWRRQWDLVAPCEQETRLASEVAGLLSASVPVQAESSIVHGDFRIDNALVRLSGASPAVEVAAVVDWELSTIGDPIADAAMMCAYRHPAFDLVLGFPTAWASDLLPSADDIAGRYEKARGVSLAAWETYVALAYYKIAVISAGIDFRWKAEGRPVDGNATAGEAVTPFLAAARELLGEGRGSLLQ